MTMGAPMNNEWRKPGWDRHPSANVWSVEVPAGRGALRFEVDCACGMDETDGAIVTTIAPSLGGCAPEWVAIAKMSRRELRAVLGVVAGWPGMEPAE